MTEFQWSPRFIRVLLPDQVQSQFKNAPITWWTIPPCVDIQKPGAAGCNLFEKWVFTDSKTDGLGGDVAHLRAMNPRQSARWEPGLQFLGGPNPPAGSAGTHGRLRQSSRQPAPAQGKRPDGTPK